MRAKLVLPQILALALSACGGAALAQGVARGAPAAAPSLTPQQIREDLDLLRTDFLPRDLSFSDEERAAFLAIVDETEAHAGELSAADFALEVSRALAVSRNGHTGVVPPMWFHRLPIRVSWFADGLYVVEAHPDFAELLGARVVRIGDLSAEQALARAAPLLSGTDELIRSQSANALTTLEVLHRIGVAEDASRASFTLRRSDGGVTTRDLRAWPAADPGFDGPPWAALSPEPADLDGRWPHVLDDAPNVPLAFHPPSALSYAWIGEGEETLYIRSNFIFSRPGDTSLDDRLIALLDDVVAVKRPRHVVLDLRYNGGGDFFNTILFAQALGALVPDSARISVLVGGATFSAALVTAAMIKDRAAAKTAFVGGTMGDHGRFWSEGGSVTLPNSGLQLTYADGLHDWSAGCRASKDCNYWPAIVFGVANVSLAPDIAASLSFSDYSAGRDTVLQAALAAAEPETAGRAASFAAGESE